MDGTGVKVLKWLPDSRRGEELPQMMLVVAAGKVVAVVLLPGGGGSRLRDCGPTV